MALESGDIDLLFAGVAAVTQAGLLIRFDRQPGLLCWVGILLCGFFGWFAHPLLSAFLVPLPLIYYLSVGARHRLIWHVALLASITGAVLANLYWLTDWIAYWWLRTPSGWSAPLLLHRTFHTFWKAPLWGSPPDRTLALVLLSGAVIGTWQLNQTRRRPAARIFGLGAGGCFLLALVGTGWEPLGNLGAPRLLVLALLFAVLPAVHALVSACSLLVRWTGSPLRGALLLMTLIVAGGAVMHRHTSALLSRCTGTDPLVLGLGPEREALVTALAVHTTPNARILWEDHITRPEEQHWTVLLPLLVDRRAQQLSGTVGRAFMGGLDPEAGIEHTDSGFVDQMLAKRPLSEWTSTQPG